MKMFREAVLAHPGSNGTRAEGPALVFAADGSANKLLVGCLTAPVPFSKFEATRFWAPKSRQVLAFSTQPRYRVDLHIKGYYVEKKRGSTMHF